MQKTTIAAAVASGTAIVHNSKLISVGGVYYNVRKGAVPYAKAKDQSDIKGALAMAQAREAASIANAPKTAARQNIRPTVGGKAGVADFLRYAERMGIRKTA